MAILSQIVLANQTAENAVYDLAKASTDLPIIFARTNTIKPAGTYLSLISTNLVEIGQGQTFIGERDDGTGTGTCEAVYQQDYEVSVLVRAYRDSFDGQGNVIATPRTALLAVNSATRTPSLRATTLDAANVSWLRSSTISDNSAVIDNEDWEQRASMTLTFLIRIEWTSNSLGDIKTVETITTIR